MSYKIVDTCIGCTACVKACPVDAITGERNKLHDIHESICVDCGHEIPRERLDAIPESVRCVQDQRLYEARLRQRRVGPSPI